MVVVWTLTCDLAPKSSPDRSERALENLADFKSPVRGVRVPVFLMNGHRRNQDFFGRDDILQQLDAAILEPAGTNQEQTGATLRSAVLCGMGGLGKTEVAIEYAFSRQDKFDVILWVNADTNEKLNLGFSEMSRALGLEDESSPKDDVASRKVVKSWFSDPIRASDQATGNGDNAASWLLILDNSDDLDALYDDFWPHTGKGSVLMTSRNPVSKDTIYLHTRCIDLQPFALNDAASLLRSLSEREFEDESLESCKEISEALGGLPLAITQMGGIIRRRRLSLKEFLIYYHEDAAKLHRVRVPGSDSQYKQTVSSVWMLEALSKSAIALLRVISFLDPDRIQESVLLQNTKNVQLPDYPRSKLQYLDARTELTQSSLITHDIKNGEIRIHRLVQDVVREQLTEDEKVAVFESTVALLSNSWPFIHFDERNSVKRLQRCSLLFPHLEKIVSLFGRAIESHDFRPSKSCAALFNEVAW